MAGEMIVSLEKRQSGAGPDADLLDPRRRLERTHSELAMVLHKSMADCRYRGNPDRRRPITFPLPAVLLIASREWSNPDMDAVDAMVLALLAVADITLIIHLRLRRSRMLRAKRMNRSLTLAVRRELAMTAPVSKVPAWKQRAAAAAMLNRAVLKRADSIG